MEEDKTENKNQEEVTREIQIPFWLAILLIIFTGFMSGMICHYQGYAQGAKDGWNFAQCMSSSDQRHDCVKPEGLAGIRNY